MSEFEGRTAVITGASRGIGRDIALGLGAAGANVVVNYVASGETAAAVADEVRATGGAALACRADVSRSADVARMMAAALDAFGGIDILVNNAGINADGPLLGKMSVVILIVFISPDLGIMDLSQILSVNCSFYAV